MYVQLSHFGSFIYENEIVSNYRVGHDGNKFRNRIGMWLRDEQRMFYEVMPLAAERMKMQDRSWIDKASRKNFLRYLSAASEEFTQEERAAIAPLFTSWAERLGTEALVKDFTAGKIIIAPIGITERSTSYIRPLAKKIAARIRR
jgi:hypothetical protein